MAHGNIWMIRGERFASAAATKAMMCSICSQYLSAVLGGKDAGCPLNCYMYVVDYRRDDAVSSCFGISQYLSRLIVG